MPVAPPVTTTTLPAAFMRIFEARLAAHVLPERLRALGDVELGHVQDLNRRLADAEAGLEAVGRRHLLAAASTDVGPAERAAWADLERVLGQAVRSAQLAPTIPFRAPTSPRARPTEPETDAARLGKAAVLAAAVVRAVPS